MTSVLYGLWEVPCGFCGDWQMAMEAAAICWIALYRELCRMLGKMSVRLGSRVLVPAQSFDTQMKQEKNGPTGTDEKRQQGSIVHEGHRSQLSLMEGRHLGKATMTGRKRRDRGWAAHLQIIGLHGIRRIMNLRVNAEQLLEAQWGGLSPILRQGVPAVDSTTIQRQHDDAK
jgi:hypothetical protein